MPDETNAERAYREDPTFRRVVMTMEALLHEARLTPHEMRAAATLACIRYEMYSGGSFLSTSNPDKVNRAIYEPFMSRPGGAGGGTHDPSRPVIDTWGGPDRDGIE
jgi:hypothetical protein